MSNRLAKETSPYLLAHKDNPLTGILGAARLLSGRNRRINPYF